MSINPYSAFHSHPHRLPSQILIPIIHPPYLPSTCNTLTPPHPTHTHPHIRESLLGHQLCVPYSFEITVDDEVLYSYFLTLDLPFSRPPSPVNANVKSARQLLMVIVLEKVSLYHTLKIFSHPPLPLLPHLPFLTISVSPLYISPGLVLLLFFPTYPAYIYIHICDIYRFWVVAR